MVDILWEVVAASSFVLDAAGGEKSRLYVTREVSSTVGAGVEGGGIHLALRRSFVQRERESEGLREKGREEGRELCRDT